MLISIEIRVFLTTFEESLCSIHTYVEQNSIFVDFFSCGEGCNLKKFNDSILCKLELNRSYCRRITRY